jgi:predicted lipoprotein with Yx(FWY)xxD motif
MLPRLALLGCLLLVGTACGTATSDSTGTAEPTSSTTSSASEQTPDDDPTSASASPESTEPAPSPTRTRSARPGTRIRVADSEFGPMLFDTSGQAIYLFDKEERPRSECYGACAADWPPVLTDGEPLAVRGARQGLLGTTKRRDGSVQVTYAGHPLYFYAHEDPWQVLCHDFVEYGGTWYVVQPGGDAAP